MSFAGWMTLLAVAGHFPDGLPRAEKSQPSTALYELSLTDGRKVNLHLLTDRIAIATRYGKLQVPVGDIRRIELAWRYPDGARKRIEAAVAQLGNDDFKIREAAGQELLHFKALAYPALKGALHCADPEIRHRATDLVKHLEATFSAEQLRMCDDDVIITKLFTIVGQLETRSLKGHSPPAGEVQFALADLRQVRPVADERALLERVRAAVRARHTSRSQQMGTGKDTYEEVPEAGALLVGFELSYGRFGDSRTIMTVCPLFRTPSGRVVGTTHGVPTPEVVRVEARSGYAVGAVTIKAGLGVDGMSVTFMEIQEGGLDPQRAYESTWLGGSGGGAPTKLAGSGAPVVGIFGKTAEGPHSTFNGLGLVTASAERDVAP
jgi:hypothetical protein